MCSFGPDTVFAVYTDDERSRETVRPRYDLEKSMYGVGLGILSYSVETCEKLIVLFLFCILYKMKIENIYIEGLNKELIFWIGTSKEDNDNMIDKASENDIWFHVNNISSCHVICKMPGAFNRKEMKYIIKTGALLCKKNTNKLKGISNLVIVYCPVKHITKTNIIGCVSVHNGKLITI